MPEIIDKIGDTLSAVGGKFVDALQEQLAPSDMPSDSSYDELPFSEWDAITPGKGYTSARLEMLDKISRSSGGGPHYEQLSTFISRLDRFNHHSLPPNAIHYGYTFITRPRLCFSDNALQKNVEFTSLLDDNPRTLHFAIRALLDTRYCNYEGAIKTSHSPLLDKKSPFLIPACNGLIGVSNFPDPTIDTKTTDAGFFSEDQTFAVGYDMLNKSYDLTLNFRDPQFGPLASMFYYWILYIGMVTKGMMPAYADDIQQLRLNYTVSIYRFLVDPNKSGIVMYSKATGCFPKSVPIGTMFDFSESEHFVRSAGNFSIPFVANKIEYNNPHIITDFNALVERYHDHGILNPSQLIANKTDIRPFARNNYVGSPYITDRLASGRPDRLRLVFR